MSSPLPPLAYHQGIVLAWDAIAGTNSIRALGTVYTNLASLVGSEAGLIRAGDNVMLVRFQNTNFVLGRVEGAGVAQRALDINYALVPTLDFHTTPATWEARNGPSVAVDIGSSRRCIIDLTAEFSVTANIEWMSVQVSGVSSIAAYPGNALVVGGDSVYIQATRRLVFEAVDGLNEGRNVFQTMHWTSSGANDPLVGEVSIIVQPF